MIEFIRGSIAELNPAAAVIDTGSIGYLLNITLTTFSVLEKRDSREVKLLVHEVIREDAHILYGFIDNREREMFRLLIGVSGIGANTARMILSSIPVDELEGVITTGDHSRLKNVKGIGLKTAQRVIVDLRDKIKPAEGTLTIQPATTTGEVFDEALAALTMLGFQRQQSQKVLKKIFEADPLVKVEAAIKRALTMM
ncbi:MAG: Holliday junction branch migration protein RuvA [Bacteroides sp.]|nr:Holliday junction branch migration protein RuvA [Bacteroides sp.]MBD5376872.1 Holliday junction branch migration protein RuvA [Bacteroides sp.]